MVDQQIGSVRPARVSIKVASTYDPQTNSWGKDLAANDYDEAQHGHLEFYCSHCLKEKNEKVRLKRPSKPFIQNIPFDVFDSQGEPIIDPDTGEQRRKFYRYEIPARYTLHPGQNHSCDLAKRVAAIQDFVNENGGVRRDNTDGVVSFHLNIKAGQRIERSRASVSAQFATQSGAKKQLHRSKRKSHSFSKGIQSVAKLAELLDLTSHIPETREDIILRIGNQTITLAALYEDDPLRLFRSLHKAAKIGDRVAALRAIHFQPNTVRRFWRQSAGGHLCVPSQPRRVQGVDGQTYFASTRLIFRGSELSDAFEDQFREGRRSFLAYTESARVNLVAFAQKKAAIADGTAKDSAVYSDVFINEPGQITAWEPVSNQFDLDFGRPDGSDFDAE